MRLAGRRVGGKGRLGVYGRLVGWAVRGVRVEFYVDRRVGTLHLLILAGIVFGRG